MVANFQTTHTQVLGIIDQGRVESMKWKEWLDEWSMTSLKFKLSFLEMEWKPNDFDKNASWELYIELLTRITTQYLPIEDGDELSALQSIYKIFELTREVIKKNGRHCIEFTKIAIVVLNQIIRPFTAKWHRISLNNGFKNKKTCKEFRKELSELQIQLRIYTQMLGQMAGVEENLTELEY
jgi:hypothetical protein